eukprot:CAMPEP_0113821210 /NCGR_PEP_ID=MMETSP0328-20130328/1624_1 /TAXON_ID=39455 /ORGANISM="Alexandrium minutum" /LENGTH=69 /DNA_ID=CAMNT_0000789141 /DNA_START=90 /DNA_END=299 /DNA_ORIENTATION=- /assembly_acc=CAM_ASM_000350
MEALRNAKDGMKDAIVTKAIQIGAPEYIGCWLKCCPLSCVVFTVDKADCLIPEEKRPEVKAAIAQYKNF